MKLKWQQRDFKPDIDFIYYHQQDDTPMWWKKCCLMRTRH